MFRWKTLGICFALVLLSVLGFSAGTPVFSATRAGDEITLEGVPPDHADALLARLSDEQVRNLLLAELQKELTARQEEEITKGGVYGGFARWLQMMNTEAGDMARRIDQVRARIWQIPADLRAVALEIGGERGMAGFRLDLLLIAGMLLSAYGIELLFRAMTHKTRGEFLEDIPQLTGMLRFWAAELKILPELVNIIIFIFAAFVLVVFVPGLNRPESRMFYIALLLPLSITRLFSVLSHLVYAPHSSRLRLLPVSDADAFFLHRFTLFFVSYVAFAIMFLAFISQMGIPNDTNILVQVVAGTILLVFLGLAILSRRKIVAEAIHSGIDRDRERRWVITRFASYWHILALSYLFIVWLVSTGQVVAGTMKSGSFLLSLLAVPIFLVLSRLGKLVVRAVIDTLRIYDIEEEVERQDALAVEGEKESRDSIERRMGREKENMVGRVNRFMRVVVLLAVTSWLFALWGYDIPYASGFIKAIFESLVTLMLGLMVWRFASGYIERKIKESLPETPEEKEESDEGWNIAVQRGRSYTLLPMVRKFIGTVLVVMVVLIILSSIGVDIGPLLAGAGVIGIAIGFGAQKLVTDILSGFFYLIDDAFRVGEYLEAGKVSGSVEAITLRNVMLRHHRGMLQIVPYSELGPITNFMRGGIVVKFNLEFSYDTDIDMVRRIIKKVGESMLKDEELGKDFIKPLKSQGVREITSSVMVIRVKFTAKPGGQFVIRREAYRRITEALMAKGIHYAHRKVIVELQEDKEVVTVDRQKLAEAGAAAGLAAIAEEEKKKAQQEKNQ